MPCVGGRPSSSNASTARAAASNIVLLHTNTPHTPIDRGGQVAPSPPQPVITQDNLVVNIDTVIYYQVTDPKSATYEIANYIQAIEQLTVTTLRNVIGGVALGEGRTSSGPIYRPLRGGLVQAS